MSPERLKIGDLLLLLRRRGDQLQQTNIEIL
jgi:hypothetical protein